MGFRADSINIISFPEMAQVYKTASENRNLSFVPHMKGQGCFSFFLHFVKNS